MGWFESVRDRWTGLWRDEAPAAPEALASTQASALETEASTITLEQASDRLLADERTRGDLTDDAFQPLLDWALDALAEVDADASRAHQLEDALSQVRSILVAVSDSMVVRSFAPEPRSVDAPHLADFLAPPLVPDDRVAGAREEFGDVLAAIEAEAGPLSAEEVTQRLAGTLRAVVAEPPSDSPTASAP